MSSGYIYDSNSINVLNYYAAQAQTSTSRNTGELGKDDFLNLLITQLQYQDPMNPQKDQDFIAQMAQFSSLEQMQNMTKAMSQTQAYSLIGKYVTASVYNKDTGEYSAEEGIVQNVKISSGVAYIVVNNKDISLENILTISNVSSSSTLDDKLAQYTGYLGYNVKSAVFDPSEGTYVSVNGIVAELAKGLYEDYAILNDVSVSLTGLYPKDEAITLEDIAKYLQENKGKEVSIYITDPTTKAKVPIKAILKDFEADEDGNAISQKGIFNVVLDNVITPVDSVVSVKGK